MSLTRKNKTACLRSLALALFSGLVVAQNAAQNATSGHAAELIQLDEKNFDSLCPRGKESDAIYGDWVLRNENFVAVIAAPKATRNANMTVRNVGGMLIDMVPRQAQSDQLSCMYPGGSRFVCDRDSTAQVEIDGQKKPLTSQPRFEGKRIALVLAAKPVKGDESAATITYSLADGDAGLSYKVEATNTGVGASELLPQELMRFDGPTFKIGQDDSGLVWAEERFFHQAYGFLPDAPRYIQAKSGRNLTLMSDINNERASVNAKDKEKEKEKESATISVKVQPGKSISWSGKVLCSHALPGLRRMAQSLKNHAKLESFQLKLNSSDGVVEQAEVEFFADGKSLGFANSDREGSIRLQLTPGQYIAKIKAMAREDFEHTFTVGDKPYSETLTLKPATHIACRVVDQDQRPIAAKIQIIGEGDTPTPDFGPDASDYAVRNLLYTASGSASHPLVPGRYTVIASHGPEYDAITKSIEIMQSGQTNVDFTLTRSIDTTGWISGEFHSHSSPSGDNTASQLGRVLNLLCEHLEFAPCTEHNRIDSYAQHLELLKATDRMATCTGMELTVPCYR